MTQQLLRCPVTKQPLREMSEEELARTRQRLARGALRRRDGGPVTAELDGGLVSDDGSFAYPVEDGVATLLADHAIVLDATPGEEAEATALEPEKQSVQKFYDEVGWQKTDDGVFEDTARFVDTRPVVEDYLSKSRLRVNRHLRPGKYLLDVASGPVQFPEYVGYSDSFEHRICTDLSVVALSAAKARLGDKGIYVLGDITNLPFQDDSIDGVVSLHTIYHVPQAEQPAAFREIHRVLKPGHAAVVAYVWGHTPWDELPAGRRILHLPARVMRRALRLIGRSGARADDAAEPTLYYHAHDYKWFASQDWPFRAEVLVGRIVTSDFLRRYIRERLLGRQVLAAIHWVEERFPRLAGRYGNYPLIVIRKD